MITFVFSVWLFFFVSTVFSESSDGTLRNFVLFWIAQTVIGIVYFFFVKTHRSQRIDYSPFLFIFIFQYSQLWAPFGVDVTDSGFMASKYWGMFHGCWFENIDLIWGSSFLGGLWESLLSEPRYLWLKTGYSLIFASIGYSTFRLLQTRFRSSVSFIAVLVAVVFSRYQIDIPNYNNISAFLGLSGVLQILQHESHATTGESTGGTRLILAGFLLGISVFSRLPNILYVAFPVLFWGSSVLLGMATKTESMKRGLFVYLGFGFALIAGAILLYTTNSLHEYIMVLFKPTSGHSIGYLIYHYYRDVKDLLFHLLVFLPFLLALYFIDIKNFRVRLKLPIYFAVLFAYFYFFRFMFNPFETRTFRLEKTTVLSVAFSLYIPFLLTTDKLGNNKENLSWFLSSLFVFIVAFVGSDVGIIAGIYSGGAVFLLAFTIAFASNLSYSGTFFRFLPIVFGLFILLDNIDKRTYYRDIPHTDRAVFQTEQLWGMVSNRARVDLVDAIWGYHREVDIPSEKGTWDIVNLGGRTTLRNSDLCC
jgi:hypothetical protein